MRYEAVVTFTGAFSMAMGEIKDIKDQPIAADLLKAGYIKAVEPEKRPAKKTAKPKK